MQDDKSISADPTNIQEVVIGDSDNATTDSVKFSPETTEDKADDTSRGGSMSTNGDTHERTTDAASVHSLPAVHVIEPQSPHRRPATARPSEFPTSVTTHISSSPLGSPTLPTETPLTPADRRHRHRSAVEVC
jgi:hypothetical protein